MEQIMELSETVAEIWHLKKKLNEIYDEKKQICSELLEVSRQLDRKINRYLKMNEEEISCLTKTVTTQGKHKRGIVNGRLCEKSPYERNGLSLL